MSKEEAIKLVEQTLQGAKVQACVSYLGDFLVRVKHPSVDEQDYDPFFLVKQNGQVVEFSVLTDGDPIAIAKAFALDI